MEVEKFKQWAKLREPNIDVDSWYVSLAFAFALKTSNIVLPYLEEFAEDYLFNLAMHLVILTPTKENKLFYKYFPNGTDDPRLKNYASFASSVSDSTSSVSSLAYEGLNKMSVSDAMLLQTPYGANIKPFNDSLTHAMVIC